jgi:predicted PurR-regulated permease PerM
LLVANITIKQSLQFTQDVSRLVTGNNITLLNIISQINMLLSAIPQVDYHITEEALIGSVQETVGPLSTYIANNALSIGSSSIQMITQAIVFVSVLITLLPITPKAFQIIKDLSPLDDQLDQKYIQRITTMARAMVRGVFVIALAQGAAAGIFLAIGGVPYVAFWTLLCIVFSLLPLGVNVITIPAGITLLAFGSIWQGLLVLLGGLVVVSNIDTFLRPMLVPKEASLNPALVLIGALGGLRLFGFLGVIYGPVVMIFLVTTVEIYLEHYRYDKPLDTI